MVGPDIIGDALAPLIIYVSSASTVHKWTFHKSQIVVGRARRNNNEIIQSFPTLGNVVTSSFPQTIKTAETEILF
jgi:hypothetical protein